MGLGAYINDDNQIPTTEVEETTEFDNPIHATIETIPRKISLRPFEQHVQNSINKIKRR